MSHNCDCKMCFNEEQFQKKLQQIRFDATSESRFLRNRKLKVTEVQGIVDRLMSQLRAADQRHSRSVQEHVAHMIKEEEHRKSALDQQAIEFGARKVWRPCPDCGMALETTLEYVADDRRKCSACFALLSQTEDGTIAYELYLSDVEKLAAQIFAAQSAGHMEMSPAEARQEAIAFISGGK